MLLACKVGLCGVVMSLIHIINADPMLRRVVTGVLNLFLCMPVTWIFLRWRRPFPLLLQAAVIQDLGRSLELAKCFAERVELFRQQSSKSK